MGSGAIFGKVPTTELFMNVNDGSISIFLKFLFGGEKNERKKNETKKVK